MKTASSTMKVADWLALAAAPTFALVAAATGILDHGAPEPLCSVMSHGSALSGMVPMYGLMSTFHVGPWLKLVSRSAKRQRLAGGRYEAAVRGTTA